MAHDFREPADGQFGVELSDKAVPAARLHEAWRDEWRDTLPCPRPLVGSEESFNLRSLQSESAEDVERPVSDDGDLDVGRATLGPGPPERANRALRDIAETPRGIDDEVVEMAIAIQVRRNR